MKRINVKIIIITIFFSLLSAYGFCGSVEAEDEDINFIDVTEESYYYDAVLWAKEQEITNGISDTEFGPEFVCSRAEAITLLWRWKGLIESSVDSVCFADIDEGSFYYEAVLWGLEKEITNGYSQEIFGPNQSVSRGEFITFLWRTMGCPQADITETPFEDVLENAYYHEALLWMLETGITTGITNSTFCPEMKCERGQIVTFLKRASDLNMIDASEYGLSTDNEGMQNSEILQELIDQVSETRGIIFIPSGEYEFAERGTQRIGSHCIKMKSNVTIKGAGEDTVLKPVGQSYGGLDMFYFNEYYDTGEPVYLENCRFSSFTIDGAGTSSKNYTSAGKGFMINLFKDCYWKNIIVMNTDATGFGVDCPIGGSMEDCIAINCGKAATTNSEGASGFGIGFGYSEDECFTISNCQSYGNKKFGYFFEHQGRFTPTMYGAKNVMGFTINNCEAMENYYNFGGIQTLNTVYEDCASQNAIQDGYYFENSKNCRIVDCSSVNEENTSFAIVQYSNKKGSKEACNIIFESCTSMNARYGALVKGQDVGVYMENNKFERCRFMNCREKTFVTEGEMLSLYLIENTTNRLKNNFEANVRMFVEKRNNWN